MTAGRRDGGWPALVVGVAAGAWWCRLELALLAVAAGVYWLLPRGVDGALAGVGVLVVLAAMLVAAPVRRLLWRCLRGAWVRRAWARATVDVGLADGPLRVPRVIRVARIPAGEVLRVRVLRGQSVAALGGPSG